MACYGNYGRYWGSRRRFMRGGCSRCFEYDGFGGRRFVDTDRDDIRRDRLIDEDRDDLYRRPLVYDRDDFMRRGY